MLEMLGAAAMILVGAVVVVFLVLIAVDVALLFALRARIPQTTIQPPAT